MKFIVICIAAVNILPSSLAMRKSYEELKEWEQFKNDYGKSYESKAEESMRKEIFTANLQYIKEHNKKYALELESYSVTMNRFGDLTNEEFGKIMLGYKSGVKKRSFTGFKNNENISLPLSIDWRTMGAVTEVKDQELCASSWAFSTTGSLEGQLFRKTGSLLSLSEQNLIDCSAAFGNDGCSGGVMDFAFKYVVKNMGIEPDSSYAYEGITGNCSFHPTKSLAAASNFIDIQKGNEFELMEVVATIGPVSAAIDASHIGFQFYSYGVYKIVDCSTTELDHAVLVVGYGTKSGRWLWDGDYYIVKNSWGSSWGMNGYVWIARNLDNMCGIATEASYPVL